MTHAESGNWPQHSPARWRRPNSVFAACSRRARSASCWRERSQRIVQVNPAFCRMLGADADQIIGGTIAELVHVDDQEELRRAILGGTG